MSSTLNVTKQLTNDNWVITAYLNAGGTLPREIFVYENLGTTQLGEYNGVISVIDLPRIQIWTGDIIPAFGNKFVRHLTATIHIGKDEDPDLVISNLRTSVQVLSTNFQAIQTSTQVYTII
jgi:hypothetical protein